MKYKRIGAYLIDYVFIILITMQLCQIRVINPYFDKYYDAYDTYNKLSSSITPENAIEKIYSDEYAIAYQNVMKYGAITTGISVVTYLLYFVGFQKWNKNQTLGKKMFKIEIKNIDEKKPVSWWQYLLRTVLVYNLIFNIISTILAFILKPTILIKVTLIINVISYIFIITTVLFVLFRKDNRGLHDIICNTKVEEIV